MIQVTLQYADGRQQRDEVDPGMDPYPLTIRVLRLPDLMDFALHPDRALQRAQQDMIDHADAEGFLRRMAAMTEAEREAEDRERWHTFALVDPETLRYEER